ncbi:hypothetical protein HZD82_22915, partial [Pantoea agglomerans]|uniref:hypothetical protein n=1 Tax=Enterobacter agglomerans TaxID=549 RepID=UPI001A8F7FC1
SRFVALDQITRDNVKDLQVAWTFRTGDTPVSPTGNGAEDQEGSRFVALDQITRDNVKDLQVAWTFRTGDTPVSPTGNGAE